MNRWIGIVSVIAVFACLTLATSTLTKRSRTAQTREAMVRASLPKPDASQPFVSSNRCQSCHPDEHDSWHRSYHRTMTQAALPENIRGTFDGTALQSGGLPYRVFTRDARPMASLPHPDELMYITQGNKPGKVEDIPQVELPVVMCTGSHHYQTYWVESPNHDGLLQTLPLVYLIKDDRWIPREAAFMTPPDQQHTLVTQWNHHCIRCHSTGGNPGLNEKTGMLETKVGELGIACESCHGPGEEHVAYHQNPVNRYRSHLQQERDSSIVNPAHLDHRAASETCGQCHGVYIMEDEYAMEYAKKGILYRPGQDLHKTRYYIQHPASLPGDARQEDLQRNPAFFRERWWDDGTILAGGREYTALSASRCFTEGELSCLTCHSMHDSDPADQLKPEGRGPASCTQCHDEPVFTSNISKHTNHSPSSTGSNCLNCHMPHTSYALFGALRSHQIQSPNVTRSHEHGVPNACNLCHLDRTLEWTQTHLATWYGQPKHTLAPEHTETAASLVWLLKGHAAQRAILAWHLGWEAALDASGNGWQAPFLAQLLTDPYGVVRYIASDRLKTAPQFATLGYDFLSSPQTQQSVRQSATDRYESEFATPSPSPQATLQTQTGRLKRELLAQFLSERDNRPVTIKE